MNHENMDYKRFFLDTEFNENKIIDLISIGITCEDGSYYYGINLNANFEECFKNEWLFENVLSQLPPIPTTSEKVTYLKLKNSEFVDTDAYKQGWRTPSLFAQELLNFFRPDLCQPIIWADYSAYDHVALAQVFGVMMDLPDGMPMHTRDLRTVIEDLGLKDEQLPQQSEVTKHHALHDAAWNMEVFYWLKENYFHLSLNFGD